MVVEMRTGGQAAKVAAVTGGKHLLAKSVKDGETQMSRRVDVGSDFEAHREAVESVSVLFKLFRQQGEELAEVPSGWTVTGAKFEVEWPADPGSAYENTHGRRSDCKTPVKTGARRGEARIKAPQGERHMNDRYRSLGGDGI